MQRNVDASKIQLKAEDGQAETSLTNLCRLLEGGLKVSSVNVLDVDQVHVTFDTGHTHRAFGFGIGPLADHDHVDEKTECFAQFLSEVTGDTPDFWEAVLMNEPFTSTFRGLIPLIPKAGA